jgi:hypothetical protein
MNSARSPLPEPPSAAKPASSGRRLVYLDALRGLLLVIMAINHIPSPLQSVTDHTFGFVSAAEGFVFLAGLMAGMVYTKKLLRNGPTAMQEASVLRALTIYRYHLVTFFIVFAWVLGLSHWYGYSLPYMPTQMVDTPVRALLLGPLLLFQPTLFDILPMYCGLILLIPVLIKSFEAGRRTLVLTGSLLLWALVNVFCAQKPFSTDWIQTGSFNICAWQVLFVFGTAFGHAWARREALIPQSKTWFLSVSLVIAAVLFAVRHAFIPHPFSAAELDWLTNKNNLAPVRLFNIAVLFYLCYLLLRRFPNVFSVRPLAFLGRSSIVVFSAHVLVAYGMHAAPATFAETISGQWLGTALMVASLFAAAAWDQKFNQAPKSAAIDARKPWVANAKPTHDK